ncbi:MAG: polysaccharide biosynthesis tyrosine autokinase, partial [Acidobacteriota bacterium]|nr:polysaccharide biosynthesis tyrosine autokinase [Acidobacteriota bacterium]
MNEERFRSSSEMAAILPPSESGRMAPPVQYNNNPYYAENEAEESSVHLSHYLWVIKRHGWKILAFVVVAVAAALIISSRLTPIYESTATVDVDRQMPQGIIGQDATRNTLNDADQFLATQIKLIQSDSVLRPVVEKYHLLEHEHQITGATTGQKTARIEAAPVLLRNLRVARPPSTYLVQISYRSPDANLAANVANDIVKSYIGHSYTIRARSSSELSSFMETKIDSLKAKMERSSEALAKFERELNVINPDEKTSILTSRLMQLNTEYTTAQADRVRKEAANQSVKSGTLESAQVSTQGEALKKITERLNEANERFADARTKFGLNHPEYKKAAAQVAELQQQLDQTRQSIRQRVGVEYTEAVNREKMLQKALAETKGQYDALNARSYEYQALKREAEADKKFYDELIRKIKEADINTNFQGNSIRLADSARPAMKPVSPNVKLNVLLAFLCSTLLGVGLAVMSDVMDETLRDPEQVKRMFNTEVMGILPVIEPRRRGLTGAIGNGSSVMPLMRLSEGNTQMERGYVEAVRTLRNSILLSSLDRHLGSILITSAGPGEGKTTTAVHFALAHAEQRHKTLLIDCDLRRPSVYKYFDGLTQNGVDAVLCDGMPWREAVQEIPDVPSLHLLASSRSSRQGTDLVGRGLTDILREASREYDLIVVDAPPLLGFAEPLQIATAVDGVVVVTVAGETNRTALASVL